VHSLTAVQKSPTRKRNSKIHLMVLTGKRTSESVCSGKRTKGTRGVARAETMGVRYTFADMDTSAAEDARFQPSSDQSLLVYFDEQKKEGRAADKAPDMVGTGGTSSAQPQQSRITLQAHERIRRLLRLLELKPIEGVRNLHPAYCSLLVKFDALRMRHLELKEILSEYLGRLETVALPDPRELEISVCYGGEYGPDLNDVAAMHGMTPAQVIELHSSTTYLVYFLGFIPGFAYLGELPEALVTPRLPTPRRSVPPGSVGIAGRQTGVYPFATPGGWRLLGRTPTLMFRSEGESFSFLSIGDCVRFLPISRERFAEMERACA
jgi:inhibitor of KinA